MGKIRITLATVFSACTLLAYVLPTIASGALCEYGVVRDYSKPLQGLPHLPRNPPTAHLPFGPARVFLNHRAGPLFVGGGEVGYSLSFSPYRPGHHLSPLLNWVVEARYVQVDRRGRAIRVRGRIMHRLKRLRSSQGRPSSVVNFLFKAGRPALYRLEITFSEPSGKRLARFGEYLRVLRPALDVRLSLNGTAYGPGERVLARLDNYGTTSLSFGLFRTIEYFDGASWGPAPNSSQTAVLLPLLWAGPGASAQCWGFTIPAGEPQGLYRMIVHADSTLPRPGAKEKPLTLSSEFRILGSG